MKTFTEALNRLEMNDQDSKGCTITLGEWLSKENVDILVKFLEALLAQERERIEGELGKEWGDDIKLNYNQGAKDQRQTLIKEVEKMKLRRRFTWTNDMKIAYNQALDEVLKLLGEPNYDWISAKGLSEDDEKHTDEKGEK